MKETTRGERTFSGFAEEIVTVQADSETLFHWLAAYIRLHSPCPPDPEELPELRPTAKIGVFMPVFDTYWGFIGEVVVRFETGSTPRSLTIALDVCEDSVSYRAGHARLVDSTRKILQEQIQAYYYSLRAALIQTFAGAPIARDLSSTGPRQWDSAAVLKLLERGIIEEQAIMEVMRLAAQAIEPELLATNQKTPFEKRIRGHIRYWRDQGVHSKRRQPPAEK